MKIITDFHIHSRFSRACSKNLTLPNIEAWCKVKGIDLIGTGDFAHPVWLSEIREQLEPSDGNTSEVAKRSEDSSEVKEERVDAGIYQLKEEYRVKTPYPIKSPQPVKFIITAEIATIWSQDGKLRRTHTILVAPNLEAAIKLVEFLEPRAKLGADGRPIIGMSARSLAEACFRIDERFLVIPAHAWTPWFAVFGSKSGFDSLEECYGDLSEKIHAIETGLSSDPSLNWQLSALDSVALISCSDAHSLDNLGREATVFEVEDPNELSFDLIHQMIIEGSPSWRQRAWGHSERSEESQDPSSQAPQDDALGENYLHSTIEFFPEEGKYHHDGHRMCEISLEPTVSKKLNNLCPKCSNPLTVGVLSRIDDLADRSNQKPDGAPDYLSIVPIRDILSSMLGKGKKTKIVDKIYHDLVINLGSEFEILLNIPIDQIEQINADFARVVQAMRDGNIKMEPGYDGVYGRLVLSSGFSLSTQESLFS